MRNKLGYNGNEKSDRSLINKTRCNYRRVVQLKAAFYDIINKCLTKFSRRANSIAIPSRHRDATNCPIQIAFTCKRI